MHEGMNRKIRFANNCYPDNVISLIAVNFILHENTGISNIDRRLDRLPRTHGEPGTHKAYGHGQENLPSSPAGPQARESFAALPRLPGVRRDHACLFSSLGNTKRSCRTTKTLACSLVLLSDQTTMLIPRMSGYCSSCLGRRTGCRNKH